jgi:hypothetical protein
MPHAITSASVTGMTSRRRGRTTAHARWAAAAVVMLGMTACVSRPTDAPRQYLDEHSAATVTVAPDALVFARPRPELAVHARDYLTVVPVDVNRAGQHVLYLYSYVWSTIDKRGLANPDATEAAFEIIADGRRIPLAPVQATPRQLGLVEAPVRAPSDSARLIIAPTTRETLEFLATASSLRAVAVANGVAERYELWSDARNALLALL